MSSSSSSSSSAARWLRPATNKEEYFEEAHQLALCLTQYNLGLCSTKPLEEALVTAALTHLYRKVPVLRVCLGQREGQLWLREMDRCVLDFKVERHGRLEEEEEKLMDDTYNTAEGPLWRVRLMPMPATQAAAGHQYVLLMGIHHSLADGFTNIQICNLLHILLDDVLAGRPIDDEEQLGEHMGDEQAQRIIEKEQQRFLQDPGLWKKRKEELLTATQLRPPLLAVLPSPQNENIKSRSVKLVLDEQTSAAFRKKCKTEGTSLHSGLTGVVNVALINMLEDLPEPLPEYDFVCSHDLGLRRYYEASESCILGCHIPTFSFKVCARTPRDVILKFWPYVKELHDNFHAALKERVPLQAVALRLLDKTKKDNFQVCFRQTADPDYSFCLSNMGDVTSMLPGDGEHVKVTSLTRFSTLRSAATIMALYVHSFKGRLNINLAYSTRFMQRETAEQILLLMKSTILALS